MYIAKPLTFLDSTTRTRKILKKGLTERVPTTTQQPRAAGRTAQIIGIPTSACCIPATPLQARTSA